MKRVFLFLCLIAFFTGCETRTTILNNVSEKDANEILLLLAGQGIIAQKTVAPSAAAGGTAVATWDISVPSAEVTNALTILNQTGLPRSKGTTLLDLFGTPGIVPSDLQDRIRYQEGLSEQLAGTIRKMDGVVDADVQITFPRDEEVTKTLTASVYVRHRGVLEASNNLLITKIKRLVSSAIPGLTPENVTVVADKSGPEFGASFEQCALEEGGGVVSIWSVVMTKDSALRFRLIFYFFIFILFVLASLLVLLVWKFYPLITERGWRSLLHPEQVGGEKVVIEKTEGEEV